MVRLLLFDSGANFLSPLSLLSMFCCCFVTIAASWWKSSRTKRASIQILEKGQHEQNKRKFEAVGEKIQSENGGKSEKCEW